MKTIDQTEALRVLAQTMMQDESVKQAWQEYQARDEADRLPYHVGGSIGSAVTDAFVAGSADVVGAFLAALESLWQSAEPLTENLLIVGVIEAIQNRLSSTPEQYRAFAALLPTVTAKQWAELDRYWSPPTDARDQALRRLAEALPDPLPTDGAPEELASAIGAAAVSAFVAGKRAAVEKFLATLESLWQGADDLTRYTLFIGVLQAMQARLQSSQILYTAFGSLLPPITEQRWSDLDPHWAQR